MTGGGRRGDPAPPDRDRRIVRRGLRAGGVAGAVLAAALGIGLAGAGGQASAAGALVGLALGAFVASGWLLLALALDVAARQPASRRRLAWTAGVTGLALLLPLLALAAGAVAAADG